jgi:hypothetical protein
MSYTPDKVSNAHCLCNPSIHAMRCKVVAGCRRGGKGLHYRDSNAAAGNLLRTAWAKEQRESYSDIEGLTDRQAQ